MDGAFIAKFVLGNTMNGNNNFPPDQSPITPSTNEKPKAKHTPAKAEYKKGSLQWLKHTFMGDEKRDDDYSDEDYW